jgi:hypothetical protein
VPRHTEVLESVIAPRFAADRAVVMRHEQQANEQT